MNGRNIQTHFEIIFSPIANLAHGHEFAGYFVSFFVAFAFFVGHLRRRNSSFLILIIIIIILYKSNIFDEITLE